MFFGTIHDDVRRYIVKNKAAFEGRSVVIGCSGNFTSEKILLGQCQPVAVHSNDVSLYSKLLADAMLETRSTLKVTEDDYKWISPYIDSDDLWQRPAMAMTLLRLLKFEKRKSVHAVRMWRNYTDGFEQMVKETAARLAERSVPITSYFAGDVLEHFRRHGDGNEAIFTAYLPFFKGDYESQYRRLQKILAWDEPTYPLLDRARKDEIVTWLAEPGRRYMFLLDYELPGLEPVMVSHKGRHTWVYVYANITTHLGLFRPKYMDTGKRFRLLGPDFTFKKDTKIGLVKISAADIQYYKGLYLARGIDFTKAEQGFAVTVDGHVAGFIEMSRSKHPPYNAWYMLSDFPVEPKPHPRFSKLIVMLALTNEMRQILEATNWNRSAAVLTTARTEKPVSMKYRGPMKLIKRGLDEDGKQYINYRAE